MRLIGKSKLLKIKKKNIGNKKLCKEIDSLISDLENFDPSVDILNIIRTDADCVHNDGFYFFNIGIHRTLILIELDENGEGSIVWVGTHQEYDKIFKNNKDTIEKWLRKYSYIE